jgi:hypothetical protein
MAKKKSPAADAADAPKPKATAAKAKKTAAKPAAPSQPLIDTNAAAAAAARMVAGGISGAGTDPLAPKATESSTFRQIKAGFQKPGAPGGAAGGGGLGNLGGAGKKLGNLPVGNQGKQVGRNQTFGADVNRSSVPRRTGGG